MVALNTRPSIIVIGGLFILLRGLDDWRARRLATRNPACCCWGSSFCAGAVWLVSKAQGPRSGVPPWARIACHSRAIRGAIEDIGARGGWLGALVRWASTCRPGMRPSGN